MLGYARFATATGLAMLQPPLNVIYHVEGFPVSDGGRARLAGSSEDYWDADNRWGSSLQADQRAADRKDQHRAEFSKGKG